MSQRVEGLNRLSRTVMVLGHKGASTTRGRWGMLGTRVGKSQSRVKSNSHFARPESPLADLEQADER